MIYAVFDNPVFSSEFAYFLSRVTDKKVLLINADTLNPYLAEFFELSDTGVTIHDGFNTVIDIINKDDKLLDSDLLMRCTNKYDNLYMLNDNQDLDKVEYYLDSSFSILLEKSKQYFDYVIINTSRNIYDSFALESFVEADTILIALPIDVTRWVNTINQVNYIRHKQNIPDKEKYIAFKDIEDIVKNRLAIFSHLDKNKYLGAIEFNKSRINYNLGYVASNLMCLDRDERENDYIGIFKKLDIPITIKNTGKKKFRLFNKRKG